MSRYIDKDKLIDSLPNIDVNNNQQISKVGALRDFFFMIEEQPEADVVEVVRCKDCKYCQDNNGGYPHIECRWSHDETPNEDDYCSYGERKK